MFEQVIKNTFLLCRRFTTYAENNRIKENYGNEFFLKKTFEKQALQPIDISR